MSLAIDGVKPVFEQPAELPERSSVYPETLERIFYEMLYAIYFIVM